MFVGSIQTSGAREHSEIITYNYPPFHQIWTCKPNLGTQTHHKERVQGLRSTLETTYISLVSCPATKLLSH